MPDPNGNYTDADIGPLLASLGYTYISGYGPSAVWEVPGTPTAANPKPAPQRTLQQAIANSVLGQSSPYFTAPGNRSLSGVPGVNIDSSGTYRDANGNVLSQAQVDAMSAADEQAKAAASAAFPHTSYNVSQSSSNSTSFNATPTVISAGPGMGLYLHDPTAGTVTLIPGTNGLSPDTAAQLQNQWNIALANEAGALQRSQLTEQGQNQRQTQALAASAQDKAAQDAYNAWALGQTQGFQAHESALSQAQQAGQFAADYAVKVAQQQTADRNAQIQAAKVFSDLSGSPDLTGYSRFLAAGGGNAGNAIMRGGSSLTQQGQLGAARALEAAQAPLPTYPAAPPAPTVAPWTPGTYTPPDARGSIPGNQPSGFNPNNPNTTWMPGTQPAALSPGQGVNTPGVPSWVPRQGNIGGGDTSSSQSAPAANGDPGAAAFAAQAAANGVPGYAFGTDEQPMFRYGYGTQHGPFGFPVNGPYIPPRQYGRTPSVNPFFEAPPPIGTLVGGPYIPPSQTTIPPSGERTSLPLQGTPVNGPYITPAPTRLPLSGISASSMGTLVVGPYIQPSPTTVQAYRDPQPKPLTAPITPTPAPMTPPPMGATAQRPIDAAPFIPPTQNPNLGIMPIAPPTGGTSTPAYAYGTRYAMGTRRKNLLGSPVGPADIYDPSSANADLPGGDGGYARGTQGRYATGSFITGDSTDPMNPAAGGAHPEEVDLRRGPAGQPEASVTPLVPPGVGDTSGTGGDQAAMIGAVLIAIGAMLKALDTDAPTSPMQTGARRFALGMMARRRYALGSDPSTLDGTGATAADQGSINDVLGMRTSTPYDYSFTGNDPTTNPFNSQYFSSDPTAKEIGAYAFQTATGVPSKELDYLSTTYQPGGLARGSHYFREQAESL